MKYTKTAPIKTPSLALGRSGRASSRRWPQSSYLTNYLQKRVTSHNLAAAAAKSLQSCPTLCDPRDSSPPGFPVPGILQARTLEWVAISFSNAWKWKVKVKSPSRVWLLVIPWTAAYQAPLSMDFPGKSTGVGCHCLLCPTILAISKSQRFIYSLIQLLIHLLNSHRP